MCEPLFLPTPDGWRFALHHPATAPVRGLVVYAHPYAEEMNKSRRMAALQARALAAAGFHVLQIDLRGCGDSSGEGGELRWQDWVQDVEQGVSWLRQRHPHDAHAPLWLWGLRAGALVAVQAAREFPHTLGACNLLLWQPMAQGRVQLQQFLRLLTAGRAAQESVASSGESIHESRAATTAQSGQRAGAEGRITQASLRQQLQQGLALEVAGYTVSSALALGMEASSLTPLPLDAAAPGQGSPRQLLWMETSPREPCELLPASGPVLQAWRDASWQVHAQAVAGPAFWQTTEIEEAPALLQATLAAMLNTEEVCA